MVKTYSLLADLGISAGEGMPKSMDSQAKERWLSDGEGVRDTLQETQRWRPTGRGDIARSTKLRWSGQVQKTVQ